MIELIQGKSQEAIGLVLGLWGVWVAAHRFLSNNIRKAEVYQIELQDSASPITTTKKPTQQEYGDEWSNLLFFLSTFASGVMTTWGLPGSSNQMMLESCWLCTIGVSLDGVIRKAINILLPYQVTIHPASFTITSNSNSNVEGSLVPNSYPRRITSAILTGLIILANYYEYRWMNPFASAACVVWVVGTFVTSLRMGTVIKAILVGQTALLILYGTIYMSNTSSTGDPPNRVALHPSFWLIPIMTIPFHAWHLYIPGLVLATTLRFDYTSSLSYGTHSKQDDISNSLSKAGYQALLLSSLLVFSAPFFIDRKVMLDGVDFASALCVTVLPMVGRIVVVAKRMGTFDAWWNYAETLGPIKDAEIKVDGSELEAEGEKKKIDEGVVDSKV